VIASPVRFGFDALGLGVVQVKVLVASSNGKLYAVGQAFFRKAAHGCAIDCHRGLLA
jgi:hypothetical protein